MKEAEKQPATLDEIRDAPERRCPVSSFETTSLEAGERLSRTGALRFVFLDASVYYVDQRGEHSGLLSESEDIQEDRCRLRTISNNEKWLCAAVELGDELIELARRSGDADAWGCTSGYYGGANPGPSLVRRAIKAVTGQLPPKPASGPLAPPTSGRWSVRQVFSYDRSEHVPCVAIWHLGFTQNPQFFPRWCEAITAGTRESTLILPDSPITRDLARRWNAGERHRRGEGWRGDSIRDYVGSAAYVRTRLSAAVDVDGSEIDGDRLASALAFLRARYQLRISPFDLLHDPLLVGQLTPIEIENQAWSQSERAKLVAIRQRYDRSQRIHSWLAEARQTPPVDVFSTGDSYSASVESCLQTAERAIGTNQIAAVLISSWTGWAPSALDRGERPEVPARTGTFGRLVVWYREIFAAAVRANLIDAQWYSSRESWHAHAYRTFPGELSDYYSHIYAAERALGSESDRRNLSAEGDFSGWYSDVFGSAAQLGIIEADNHGNIAS